MQSLGPSSREPSSKPICRASETLGDERLRSRRLCPARSASLNSSLRSADEPALSRALVQAAAIWYDVDARIYRRDLSGAFSSTPGSQGVQPEADSNRLSRSRRWLRRSDLRRLASARELGETAAGHDALLLPISVGGRADWVLALIGTVPVRCRSRASADWRALPARSSRPSESGGPRTRAGSSTASRRTQRKLPSSSPFVSFTCSPSARSVERFAVAHETRADAQNCGGRSDRSGEAWHYSRRRTRIAQIVSCASLALGGEDSAVLDLHAGPGQEFSSPTMPWWLRRARVRCARGWPGR